MTQHVESIGLLSIAAAQRDLLPGARFIAVEQAATHFKYLAIILIWISSNTKTTLFVNDHDPIQLGRGDGNMSEIQELTVAAKIVQEWVDDLVQRLGWHDRERAYRVLLAMLHALRDALASDEAVYMGAQLPPLLRGLYYEGWHPSERRAAPSRSAFIERIRDGVHRDPAVDAEEVARAVLAMLAARLPEAEIEDAKAATPQSLHNLWPS